MATETLTPDISKSRQILNSTALSGAANNTVTVKYANQFSKIAVTTIADSLDATDGDLAINFLTLDGLEGSEVGSITGVDRYANATTETNKGNGNKVWELENPCFDSLEIDFAAGTATAGTIQVYVSLTK